MSTQPIQPAWKQEVNQRLAAHKHRKGTTDSTAQTPEPTRPGTSRAAEAAARVAARYAKAPSYTQMQAEEARAAVRAAEIATQVAMEAQAVAHTALAELHAAAEQRGPASVESITRQDRLEGPVVDGTPLLPESSPDSSAPAKLVERATMPERSPVLTQEVIEGKSFNLRWEPDTPARALQVPAVPARPQQKFELAAEDWWTPAQLSATLHSEPIEVDAQPGHANLIEFPRELVASRRLRPRLADPAGAGEGAAQLSIFEIDPGTISFEPMTEPPAQPASSSYSGPGWSGMELDAQPDLPQGTHVEDRSRRGPYLAPFGLRLMALAIDLSLILASFSAAAIGIASKLTNMPPPRPAEALAIVGLLSTAFAYHALFFAWSNMTPGMWYAGIALCTFDDDVPTRRQLRRRLGAMAVSLLPVGLGLVWSVFDDDHLSWHDRISSTYLRKR